MYTIWMQAHNTVTPHSAQKSVFDTPETNTASTSELFTHKIINAYFITYVLMY